MNKLIAKAFNKKMYKAEIYISDDNFTAEYYSDSLSMSLKWVIAGLTESYSTSTNTKSMTRGVYGTISKYTLLHISDGKLKIGEYKYPKTIDYLFMTDAMVYVPDSIVKQIKSEDIPAEIFK